MNPTFLILYVVIVTVMIMLFLPRLRDADPKLSLLFLVIGLAGLFVLVFIASVQ